MKTDDLIRALAADGATRRASVERAFVLLVLAGIAVAAILFAVLLGPRADLADVAGSYLFKLIVTLSLAIAAAWLATRLARPGADAGFVVIFLLAAPLILGSAVLIELATVEPAMRVAKAVGNSWQTCLTYIPILALPVLVAALLALRHGAPTRPALSGAVAGLAAGGFGAALYAAYCLEDSPLFLATWYTLAILGVAAAGALVGPRVLRW
ncbi:MAG TPA: DUF1109 domain-containing protein [Xanthobacteraceae bacterium]|nr:DUF1109 domain-containing protein [Xanthobacteraceae bacterium]